MFSKAALDTLLEHSAHDYKIELIALNTLTYSPLYKISTSELKALKEYLLNNLMKGFIKPSNAPFATLMLFIAKPNSGLRFYIDY